MPTDSFTELLNSLSPDGTGFVNIVGTLFREMNTGTQGDISVVLRQKLLRFNGGLFADDTVLPVNGLQLGLLKQAASKQWKDVEPAIFGTLLERALNPTERHALGAHFTPRAYVERLVLPTVIQPLREEWENVRAAAITHANKQDFKSVREELNRFHNKLCDTTVLDPACGSGNFLYVALAHMKILEGEVIDLANQFGDVRMELSTHTVDPHQFLGIELNPRAASIAELVLWIGYLQWHFRTRGQVMPEEPVLKSFKNIECRDAVLEYDGEPQPALNENGEIITLWDRRSMKVDFSTGRNVPDETKRVPLLTYANPRPAKWPAADFIVGNPPFIGDKRMRDDLGDGYTETLRSTYTNVPGSADFVLYWWHKAAEVVRAGSAKRFGLITTNSLRQSFNRRVVESQLSANPSLSVVFAIPDHPWVDTAEGASVRIAMTVGSAGEHNGELLEVIAELQETDGSSKVSLESKIGKITSDLKIRVGVATVKPLPLSSNKGMAFTGMYPLGQGFVLQPEQIGEACGNDAETQTVVKPFIIARDLAQSPRSAKIIDFFPLNHDEARQRFPNLFQWTLTRVKPERDVNPVLERQKNWWLFTRPIPPLRKAVSSLSRYIVVPRTAKWFTFQFIPPATIPDTSVVAIVSEDSFVLGVLSSRIHFIWAMEVGGRLEDRPRYQHQETFNLFPFPLCDEATKDRIRAIAEELDAHRKRVQSQHGLTLTGMYNVLAKLRVNQPLTDKEKTIHDQGLVSILRQLHDDLDAAVFAAYGWPATLTDAEILTRLVALNAQRAAEEKQGIIHWLRPDYQTRFLKHDKQTKLDLTGTDKSPKAKKTAKKQAKKTTAAKTKPPWPKPPWPKPLAERIRVTEQALHAAATPAATPAAIQELLESLVVLGRAQEKDAKFSI